MKNKRALANYFFFIFVLSFSFVTDSKAEDPVVRIGKPTKDSRESSIAESLGNYLAIKTGQVRDGEQIPLPSYQDGKRATRKEAQYLVSPAEIPTSLTYITGQASGTFYIKCDANSEGTVHISLWQQSGTGEGTKVVGSDTYRLLKESFKREGVTSAADREDDENVVTSQMRVLSDRLKVNYIVIALRSPKNTD